MDRTTRRFLMLATGMVMLATIASQSGCVNALATAAWLIKGNDVGADYNGLRNKRVAVVCRPLVELQYSTGTRSTQEMAVMIGEMIGQRVRKVSVVDPREVAEWTDEHDWEDFAEVGQALKADMVIGIDVEEFSLFQSQTLYQGKARMNITVYDVADGGKVVYKKSLPRITFPPNRGVDTSMPEDDFRRRFVAHLSDIVGRHFYSHDATSDVALDAVGFTQE
ncbi:MAG TPA: hypothetical protein VHD36_01445 [Pirellulales bacterium]|nr:hypothetical protein [Pirellulales bacterium]